jgi:hypothetical protein
VTETGINPGGSAYPYDPYDPADPRRTAAPEPDGQPTGQNPLVRGWADPRWPPHPSPSQPARAPGPGAWPGGHWPAELPGTGPQLGVDHPSWPGVPMSPAIPDSAMPPLDTALSGPYRGAEPPPTLPAPPRSSPWRAAQPWGTAVGTSMRPAGPADAAGMPSAPAGYGPAARQLGAPAYQAGPATAPAPAGEQLPGGHPAGAYPPSAAPFPLVPGQAAPAGQLPAPSAPPSRLGLGGPVAAAHGKHERARGRRGWDEVVDISISTARRAASEDERLLAAIRQLLSLPSLYPRVIFLTLGFAAISPLAAAYAELLPLPTGARFVLLPAMLVLVLIGFRHAEWGRRALVGYVAGIIATGIYDMLRLGLTQLGMFPGDPIPGIGRLLLDDPNAHWIWGYLWRFLGNGAGMGLAFTMLPWRGVRSGIVYGTAICLGLFGVLAVWPQAQLHFFPLTLPTAIGAMAGHWVYGGVLGWISSYWLPPTQGSAASAAAAGAMAGRAAP